jgi:hypothetical protein
MEKRITLGAEQTLYQAASLHQQLLEASREPSTWCWTCPRSAKWTVPVPRCCYGCKPGSKGSKAHCG